MNSLILLFSNHGGRQVDTAVTAIECLEDIINVVNGRAEGRYYFITISSMFSFLKILLRRYFQRFICFYYHILLVSNVYTGETLFNTLGKMKGSLSYKHHHENLFKFELTVSYYHIESYLKTSKSRKGH
jgi:hypothetical protein